jgi:sorting nexin-29
MPQEWNTAIICPIHKKNDKTDCNNYRGISLLNIVYKIFSKVLARKLEPYAEEVIGEYQCGRRRNRSTIDHMFALRMILEKCYKFNINVHQLYTDFKQAYDSINKKKLYDVLKEMQIPAK